MDRIFDTSNIVTYMNDICNVLIMHNKGWGKWNNMTVK